MTHEAQVQTVMQKLHNTKPSHAMKYVGDLDAGAMGVVKFLHQTNHPVKSKDISDRLQISSARMAVLLKKLESKGLVEKIDSAEDARVTLVQLAPRGEQLTAIIHKNFLKTAEDLIEEFGIDYLIRLLDDIVRFKRIMERNHKQFEEDIHD